MESPVFGQKQMSPNSRSIPHDASNQFKIF
jgi:hypothetical protein